MQTMGLINDAKGSSVFTFDDAIAGIRPAADRALMRALYEPQFRPGDPVEGVVEEFSTMFLETEN